MCCTSSEEVVQVYGICLHMLHLSVISVMIIGAMRIRTTKEQCQRADFGTICSNCANELFEICVFEQVQ